MKIIWIVPGFQSDAPDRNISVLPELAYRVAREHRLKIFVLYSDRDSLYRTGRVEVRSFRQRSGSGFSKLGRFGPLAKAAWQISREPGEVVHAFGATAPAMIGLAANFLYKRPLIVSCLDDEPGDLSETGHGRAGKRLVHFWLNRIVARAAAITIGSETQAGLLKARYPGLRPVVLPFGVNRTCSQNFQEAEDSLEICAGRTIRLYDEVIIKSLKKRI